MLIDQPPQSDEQQAAAEEFKEAYALRHPDAGEVELQSLYENSVTRRMVDGENSPEGFLEGLSPEARLERARRIGREIGRSMSVEREYAPEVLLEVGTVNSGGIPYHPGFNLSELTPDSVVYTVDLLQKFQGEYQSEDDPLTDTGKLKTLYTNEVERLRRMGKEVPELTHIPLLADGRELPFADNTFDKVLFNDVIGDPAVRSWNIAKLIEEALRVVKVGGEIWVVDDRGSGANFKAFEELFPNGEDKPYVRSEDLRFWHFDIDVSPVELCRLQREYDALANRVIADEPEFYIMRKTADIQQGGRVARIESHNSATAARPFRSILDILRRRG